MQLWEDCSHPCIPSRSPLRGGSAGRNRRSADRGACARCQCRVRSGRLAAVGRGAYRKGRRGRGTTPSPARHCTTRARARKTSLPRETPCRRSCRRSDDSRGGAPERPAHHHRFQLSGAAFMATRQSDLGRWHDRALKVPSPEPRVFFFPGVDDEGRAAELRRVGDVLRTLVKWSDLRYVIWHEGGPICFMMSACCIVPARLTRALLSRTPLREGWWPHLLDK